LETIRYEHIFQLDNEAHSSVNLKQKTENHMGEDHKISSILKLSVVSKIYGPKTD